MSIYDEAIKEVKNIWNGNELTYPKKTIEALERAKKEHELLGLYRLEKELNEKYGYNETVPGLSRKLSQETIRHKEVLDIQEIIKQARA